MKTERIDEVVNEELFVRKRDPLKQKTVKQFKCSLCSKRFAKKSHLNSHIRTVHSEERPYHCNECNKTFKRADCLHRHSSVHTSIKLFTCKMCKKTFSRKDHLNRHTKSVHENSRPYVCEECNKSFSQASNLKAHTKTVHRNEHNYQCPHCTERFKSKPGLDGHIGRYHEPSYSRKTFKCQEWESMSSANIHHLTHRSTIVLYVTSHLLTSTRFNLTWNVDTTNVSQEKFFYRRYSLIWTDTYWL
jgi:uncharacterized Zn-finger protein